MTGFGEIKQNTVLTKNRVSTIYEGGIGGNLK
jgi:hypothetical protein